MALEEFMDRMILAGSVGEVWTAVQEYFEANGFDRVIYADMTGTSAVVLNSFPETFGQYYFERCNPRDDPFFRYCCSTLAPISTGYDYLDQYSYLTPSERAIIETAREAGMRAGFSCTVHLNRDGPPGGWNIGSTLDYREVEKIRSERADHLRLVALYAHERIASLRNKATLEGGPKLSPRERDCLAYLAAGMKTQQIADALGIKSVTVELHLRGARDRLGAKTREQALAKALSLGLLSL